MGIDRPGEDDAPDPRHDSAIAGTDRHAAGPSGAGLEVADDSEAARAACYAEYRAKVAAEYGSGDDPQAAKRAAWAEALPAERERWAEHERQYPYPERSLPTVAPDGSWRCGDLELTAKHNAEVDHSRGRIREAGEKAIIPAIRAIEAEDTSRCLAGFEHCFKGADRIKEKVADTLRMKSEQTPTQALASGVQDAVRFTFQYDEGSYTAGVRKDVERLESRGFIQLERRNTWTSDQYKGINSRWREPESGLVFEVQFHTQASFEAKELTHKAYERIRSGARDPEKSRLKEFQGRVNDMIPLPPGVTEYESYKREERDG